MRVGSRLSMPCGMPAPSSISGDRRCADQIGKLCRNRGKHDFWQVSLCGSPAPMMRRKNKCQKIIKSDEEKKNNAESNSEEEAGLK
jgi:hypothetical protein